MLRETLDNIVPHLLCKGNMLVPYLDFRKSSKPVRSPMPHRADLKPIDYLL